MQSQTRSVALLLVLLTGGAKCEKYPPPEILLCATGSNHTLNCNDTRLSPPNFNLPYRENLICTDTDSYDDIDSYCSKIRTDLINCKRKCNGPY